jgi:hypothetical protein
MAVLCDDFGAAPGVPRFVSGHDLLSLSVSYHQLFKDGIVLKINKAVSCCDSERQSIGRWY